MEKPPDARPSRWRRRGWTLRALLLLVLLRTGLFLLPFHSLQRLQGRAARIRVRREAWPDPWIPALARSVERAARLLPGEETCLAQAMVGQILLARAGHASSIKIGVARPRGGVDRRGRRLLAHAWLESRGVTLIGQSESGRYTVFGE